MIRQDDTNHRVSFRDLNFEGIALDPASDRAEQRQAHPLVVGPGGQDECRAASCLLAAGLGIEGDTNYVTTVWDIGHPGSPDLTADRRTGFNLVMKVVFGHLLQKIFQRRDRAWSH